MPTSLIVTGSSSDSSISRRERAALVGSRLRPPDRLADVEIDFAALPTCDPRTRRREAVDIAIAGAILAHGVRTAARAGQVDRDRHRGPSTGPSGRFIDAVESTSATRLLDRVAAGQVDLIDVDRAGAFDVEFFDARRFHRAIEAAERRRELRHLVIAQRRLPLGRRVLLQRSRVFERAGLLERIDVQPEIVQRQLGGLLAPSPRTSSRGSTFSRIVCERAVDRRRSRSSASPACAPADPSRASARRREPRFGSSSRKSRSEEAALACRRLALAAGEFQVEARWRFSSGSANRSTSTRFSPPSRFTSTRSTCAAPASPLNMRRRRRSACP